MGTLSREIYSDNSTFVENARDSWAGIGPLAAPVQTAPTVLPENATVSFAVKTTFCEAKIQISRSSPSQIAAGIAFWQDLTALTGAGATDDEHATAFDGVRGVRLWIDDAGGGAGGTAELYGIVIPEHSYMGRANMVMTPIGGFAELKINRTAGPSVYGAAIEQHDTSDFAVRLAVIDSQAISGAFWTAGAPVACWALVAEAGEIAYLMTDGQAAALGEIVIASGTVAGRVDAVAPPGNVVAHFREAGHVLETKGAGAGVLVRCHAHFN